jgi:hypothetical protein
MDWRAMYRALLGDAKPAWAFLKVVVPFVISLIALYFSVKDRRPRLQLRARKGEWCVLKPALDKKEFIFMGIVEVYNVSARANAIRAYEMHGKRNGHWEKLESERYRVSDPDMGEAEVFNHTPLMLAPYSGMEVHVQAFGKMPQPYEMDVKVEVEDLFGKKYHATVKAKS